LVEAFKRTVEELESIGHAYSTELADGEYREILADVRDSAQWIAQSG
jgi:hypothetical protein